ARLTVYDESQAIMRAYRRTATTLDIASALAHPLPGSMGAAQIDTNRGGKGMATATLRAVSHTEKGHRCEFYRAAAGGGDGLVRIGALLEELSQQNTYGTERAALVRDALIDRIHDDIVHLLDTVLAKVADYELLED